MSAIDELWMIRQAFQREIADSADAGGSSPLMRALLAHDSEAIHALLVSGCAIGLHEAAMLDDATALRRLIASGNDALMTTPDGWTALHLAAFAGAGAVIDTLLGLGLWVDHSGGPQGDITALGLAVASGHASVTQQLLDAGADPSRADAAGWTPLHQAAAAGDLHLVKRLLVAGAGLNTLCGDTTPLGLAQRQRHRHVVALLRQVGGTD